MILFCTSDILHCWIWMLLLAGPTQLVGFEGDETHFEFMHEYKKF